MSTLNEFIGQVKGGIAKTTHFDVLLNLPEALLNNNEPIRSNMNKILLFCDQAQLPGLAFSTSQVRTYGEFKEVPYEKLYEPITLSFYVDADMVVKSLFDKWMSLIQNPSTRDFNYPSVYMTDSIDIIVHDSQNKEKYKCTLYKCYPKAVAPIQLDYAAKDVMKLQVTIIYQYANTTMLSSSTKMSSTDFKTIGAQMPNYNYGYESFVEVPKNYFNDFVGFQKKLRSLDFSVGGVKSLLSSENIGEFTGFGGIFK